MTDRWDRTLDRLGQILMRPTQEARDIASPSITVPINLTVNSHVTDRRALQEFVEDDLTDLVVQAVNRGSYRRG